MTEVVQDRGDPRGDPLGKRQDDPAAQHTLNWPQATVAVALVLLGCTMTFLLVEVVHTDLRVAVAATLVLIGVIAMLVLPSRNGTLMGRLGRGLMGLLSGLTKGGGPQ